MFPLSVDQTIPIAYTGTDLRADLSAVFCARIVERGGVVVRETPDAIAFSNPVLQLRPNWHLFAGVTSGTIRLETSSSQPSISYSISLRRLMITGALFALLALLTGILTGITLFPVAFFVIFAIDYAMVWLRLSSALTNWIRDVPGVFIRSGRP